MGMYWHARDVDKVEADLLLRDPQRLQEVLLRRRGAAGVLSLEKSWHGLHFVLTESAWEGEGPLGFILAGGQPIEGMDTGYGPPRILMPDHVIEIAAALDGISDAEFDRRFDVERMAAEQVYPFIWDEPRPDLLDEYLGYFHELKQFVRRAAEERHALIVYLG
jgi:hypothetical protein